MNASRIGNAVLMLIAVGISLGILASGIPASHARNAVLAINWLAWFLFVATYPFAALGSGFVTGTEPGSASHRDVAPARFWTGLVATTLFWIAMLATVSLCSFMAWYRGT